MELLNVATNRRADEMISFACSVVLKLTKSGWIAVSDDDDVDDSDLPRCLMLMLSTSTVRR